MFNLRFDRLEMMVGRDRHGDVETAVAAVWR